MGSGIGNSVETERIARLIEDWASAVRRRDIDGILRHHAADFLMFDVPPPLQLRGLESYAASWDAFFAWADDPVRFDFVELSITASTDLAFATGVIQCGGSAELIEVRITFCLQRAAGEWTFVHEHHSVPAVE
jgi:ketosteroid isomerase-like protein